MNFEVNAETSRYEPGIIKYRKKKFLMYAIIYLDYLNRQRGCIVSNLLAVAAGCGCLSYDAITIYYSQLCFPQATSILLHLFIADILREL